MGPGWASLSGNHDYRRAVTSSAPSSIPDRLSDFTDRWPPMLVKEMRQGLRAKWFVMPFLFLHLLAFGMVALEYLIVLHTGSGGAASLGLGWLAGGHPGLFWMMIYIVVAGIMPLRVMESLREEALRGNTELLLLGGMSRWQIVRGKWLVQGALTLLALLSLVPYMLVRYFLGGVELWQNLLTCLSVSAAAMGMAGTVLGVSGYPGLGIKFVLICYSGVCLLLATMATEGAINTAGGVVQGSQLLVCVYVFCYALVLHLLFAITGMQLGRAHLKIYLLPFEIPPTRTVVILTIFMPFILIAGAFATCGFGAILVLALMVYIMCVYDRPVKTTLSSGAPMPGYPRF